MPDFHLVAHARDWLYTRDREALHLWRSLARSFPEAHACCLMPDHVHLLLPHADADGRFTRVRAGYSRWLGSQPRWSQPFRWGAVPAPAPLAADPGHLRRCVRYIELNPCRARLITDPLAWSWSTHRDATGFAATPWLRVADCERFHAYVAGDPTVENGGSSLPRVQGGTWDLASVSQAVGAVFRTSAPEVVHGRPRQTALRVAATFGHTHSGRLAEWADCGVRQVERLIRGAGTRWSLTDDDVLNACIRAVGDDRMEGLQPGDLTRTPVWQEYRRGQAARRGRAAGSSPLPWGRLAVP